MTVLHPVLHPVPNPGRLPRRALLAAAAGGLVAGCTGRNAPPPAPTTSSPASLAQRVRWGAYASPEPFPDCSSHLTLEEQVGRELTMSWFTTWAFAWPRVGGQEAAEQRRDLHVAWQPRDGDGAPVSFRDVLAGRHDDYLRRFFDAVAAHPGRVTVRFAHEMNMRSYPWSLGYQGDRSITSTGQYTATWRHVVDAARAHGVRNLDWAWCIGTRDRGPAAAEEYFPGADHVDVLAMDVYVGYGGYWQNPHDAIAVGYDRLARLAPDLPIWVTELGCREPSKVESAGDPVMPKRSKAQWLQDLFAITDFPRLAVVDFFNKEKDYDWRLDSGPGTLAAVRDALAR